MGPTRLSFSSLDGLRAVCGLNNSDSGRDLRWSWSWCCTDLFLINHEYLRVGSPRHCLLKHVLRFFWPLCTLSPAPLQVQFIMPKSAADQMQSQIGCGTQGIDEVIESLSHVDSARATAWKLEDETKVKLETKFEYVSHLIFQRFQYGNGF